MVGTEPPLRISANNSNPVTDADLENRYSSSSSCDEFSSFWLVVLKSEYKFEDDNGFIESATNGEIKS
jgi:hypothetical protein